MKVEVQEGSTQIGLVISCPKLNDEVRDLASRVQGLCDQWSGADAASVPESGTAFSPGKLAGEKDGATFFIDRQEVLYCDTVDKRYFIYTEADVFETRLKLYELERLLIGSDVAIPSAPSDFFRSSKSQLTNIQKIASLRPDFNGRLEVVLTNGERLIVSRQYAKALKERLGLK